MLHSMPERLLAKSRRFGREDITLQRHLFETEQAAVRIFRLDGRWGRNWCRFFKLYDPELQQKFLTHLRIAALFHDIGKANEDFYEVVSRGSFLQQSLRHEHLSALILHLPTVRQWLSQNKSLDVEIITAAVLSHHLKAAEGGDWKWGQSKAKSFVRLFCAHPEVKAVLERIREVADLADSIEISVETWAARSPWTEAWQDGILSARRFNREIRSSAAQTKCSLLLAVKAAVIVADAASSGLVREGHTIDDWIDEVVHSKEIGPDEISAKILNPKKHQLLKDNPTFDWHMFQKKAATLGDRALLLAACGSGKTVAAWKWAEAQMKTNQIGKVVFLYPTRGTATEGFRDYVGWAPEAEGAYVAGDSRYVLEDMTSNPSEATQGKHFELSEAEQRLFALGLWSRRFFSATVDQFLSFMEHGYGSLCLLPALADSALIIDEVHSFDRHMFDNLISFLRHFNVPVLCMTATLPPSRRYELVEAGLRVYPNDHERAELEDLTKKECHPRYSLEFITDETSAMKIAAQEYKAEKRVLWVVNTVKQCQTMARLLSQEPYSIRPLIYHSRFRLKDRKDRHNETVNAFKQIAEAKIALTTQVCEMSLDLDADVLITEYAPVSSLVQRFGRANRHLVRGKDFRARLIVYKPESDRPYNRDELLAAECFLRDLGATENISQELLATELESHALAERIADGSARFIESGYYATPGLFRDIDEFTVPCILTGDLDKVRNLLKAKRPFDEFVINVPKKFAKRLDEVSWLPKYLRVVDQKLYDKHYGLMTGFEEQE